MYKIKYIDEALIYLERIAEFISNTLNNPGYARKITQLIRSKVRVLKSSPERCEPFPFKTENPNFPSPNLYVYRKLIVKYYIVFYVVDHQKKTIRVVTIVDGRSDYQNKI